MKRNNNSISILLLLLLVSLQNCGQRDTKMETYDHFRMQRIEARDSIFVVYTVKEWHKKDWWTYHDYSRMYKMTNDDIEYFIGGAFYSPDKRKIIVWIGEKLPNATSLEMTRPKPEYNRICPTEGDTIYRLDALIGIRDSINQLWKLYPLELKMAICCVSKEQAISILGKYFFVQMKYHKMARMIQSGEKKGELESVPLGYNLQDKDFWDKCWLFQKDTVGSYGLYPFQIYGYDYRGRKKCIKCADPFNPPAIDYPEEILKLYK